MELWGTEDCCDVRQEYRYRVVGDSGWKSINALGRSCDNDNADCQSLEFKNFDTGNPPSGMWATDVINKHENVYTQPDSNYCSVNRAGVPF